MALCTFQFPAQKTLGVPEQRLCPLHLENLEVQGSGNPIMMDTNTPMMTCGARKCVCHRVNL